MVPLRRALVTAGWFVLFARRVVPSARHSAWHVAALQVFVKTNSFSPFNRLQPRIASEVMVLLAVRYDVGNLHRCLTRFQGRTLVHSQACSVDPPVCLRCFVVACKPVRQLRSGEEDGLWGLTDLASLLSPLLTCLWFRMNYSTFQRLSFPICKTSVSRRPTLQHCSENESINHVNKKTTFCVFTTSWAVF